MALLNIVRFNSEDLATVQMKGLANDNAWDADFQFIDGMGFDNGDLTLQKGWAGLASNNLEQSAKSGSGLAQSCLSHMYREGFGVEKDPVKAFQWCSAAAEHKDKPEGGNISNIHLSERNADFFSFKLDLEVKNVEHMRTIIAALQANNFVERVERANTG